MAHELTFTNGKAEMAYVGETPWHGLGEKLEAGASIETWLKAAGMEWGIKSSPVQFSIGDGINLQQMDNRKVLYRSDNQMPLSVVGDGYKPVQPREVLEFFRDLTETAGYVLETAGTLFGGTRMWALAKTKSEDYVLDKKDSVRNYLLLSTACDGSMMTEGRETDVRVVCNNTLSGARSLGAARVKVSHSTTFDASAVKVQLGVEAAAERFHETMNLMRKLASTKVDDATLQLQTAELFRPGAMQLVEDELAKVLAATPLRRVVDLAEGKLIGAGLKGGAGTQWGWLNAVTQYVDHEARARSTNNRLNSAWFGKGDAMKSRAFEMANAVASGGLGALSGVGAVEEEMEDA